MDQDITLDKKIFDAENSMDQDILPPSNALVLYARNINFGE